jgi:excisionase family DNA binding protein
MDPHTEFNLDRILDVLAEKMARHLSRKSGDLQPRLLTLEQAAVYIGRTPEATQHLASSGKIPTVRSDRRVFIDRLDLDEWIKDNKTGWA